MFILSLASPIKPTVLHRTDVHIENITQFCTTHAHITHQWVHEVQAHVRPSSL